MKYIIEIEDEPFGRNDDPVIPHGMDELYRAKGFRSLVFDKNGLDRLTPYTEPDRKAIEDEVWEFADYMCTMSQTERCLCFGFSYSSEVTTNLTYQEAKSLFEKWMKSENETFDTGDEVYDKEVDSKGVILRRYNSDTLDILWDDGSAGETIAIKAITKTGRHFDEVAELLEKMRGEE